MPTSFQQFLERKMKNVYDIEKTPKIHKNSKGEHLHANGEITSNKLLHNRVSSAEDILGTLHRSKKINK